MKKNILQFKWFCRLSRKYKFFPFFRKRKKLYSAPNVLFALDRNSTRENESCNKKEIEITQAIRGSLEVTNCSNRNCFYFDEYRNRTGSKNCDFGLLELVAKEKPDLLVIAFGTGNRKQYLSTTTCFFIKRLWRIPVVFIWYEHLNGQIARKYKSVASAQISLNSLFVGSISDDKDSLQKVYTPITDSYKKKISENEKDIDVLFLNGNLTDPHHKKVYDALVKSGITCNLFKAYQSNDISDLKALLKQSKIIIQFVRDSNVHFPESYDVLQLLAYGALFIRVSEKQNKKIRVLNYVDPNLKKQKAIYCNCLSVSELQKLFYSDEEIDENTFASQKVQSSNSPLQEGQDYLTFSSSQDLINKIKYYLENEKEREAITTAAQNKARYLCSPFRFWDQVFGAAIKGYQNILYPENEENSKDSSLSQNCVDVS